MATTHPGRAAAAWLAATCALLTLNACGGGGGGTGPTGPPGPQGPPGPSAPVEIGPGEPLPGNNVVITGVAGGSGPSGKFKAGDVITVFFTAKDDAGNDLDVPSMDSGSIYVSGPTSNYQRVIASQSDLRAASVFVGGGVWSYTFAVPIPAAYIAPLNDSPAFGPADGELTGQPLLDGTYTVGMQAYIIYEVDGEELRDAGNGVFDFLLGAAATLDPRRVVESANCNVCHTELTVHGGGRHDIRLCVLCHTAGAEDRNTPSVLGGTPGVSIEFKVMIHKLHNGSHLPSVLGIAVNPDGTRNHLATPEEYEILGFNDSINDFSEINFPVWPNFNVAMPRNFGYSALSSTDPDGTGPLLSPRARDDRRRMGVTACLKCHGDPDAGGPLAAPADGMQHRTNPSRQACGACHDDIDWTKTYVNNGQTMPANPSNASCSACHADTAANQPTGVYKPISIYDAHLHPLEDANVDAGVNTVITSVTGGTGAGGSFQVGDTPTAVFTLKTDAGADLGVAGVDACSAFFLGPTTNRQLVMPLPSANGMTLTPLDFSGRLQAVSTSGKGSMSKVFLGATAAREILVAEFTSSTVFTVSRVDPVTGAVLGSLGAGTLPAATSTNPSGSSLGGFDLAPTIASTTTATVVFSSATNFTVNVSGSPVGTGTLPASTNASMRFTSSTISMNVTVGGSAPAAGNTFNVALFRGAVANPVLFAVVAGTTAFSATAGAPDRFYDEVWPNQTTYTLKIPMDLVFEYLADGTGAPAQVLPPAGNLPVYYGRQQLWQATTTASTTTSLSAVTAMSRQMDVAGATGFANGDTVVVEPAAGLGVREYLQVAPARADGVISVAADTTVRLWFKTPLRYAHAAGVTVTKVTLALKQEGAANAYVLNPVTGVATGNAAFTAGAGIVMSYRADSRFGYRRHSGDAVQATYVPPANDSTDIGQEQGEWKGLPYQDGTYTVDMWFAKNLDVGLQNEVQTYRSTSFAATKDFLYGGATTIVPHQIISSAANCYTCHNDIFFHGGGRRGVDACLTCHSVSGNEDKPRWDTPLVSGTTTPTALTPGVAIEFRQMLHKIHMGSGLANAATYTVVGNGGSPSQYGEVEFPAMPGGVKQCIRCHGNDSWKAPAPRSHTSALVPTRTWGFVCGACHDGSSAQAHISANTSVSGAEACEVCHGPGSEAAVEIVHFPR